MQPSLTSPGTMNTFWGSGSGHLRMLYVSSMNVPTISPYSRSFLRPRLILPTWPTTCKAKTKTKQFSENAIHTRSTFCRQIHRQTTMYDRGIGVITRRFIVILQSDGARAQPLHDTRDGRTPTGTGTRPATSTILYYYGGASMLNAR